MSSNQSDISSNGSNDPNANANANVNVNSSINNEAKSNQKSSRKPKINPLTALRRSNSISNGVLQHSRNQGKRVSFSNLQDGNDQVTGSHQVLSSTSSSQASSANSSDDEYLHLQGDHDDDDELDDDELNTTIVPHLTTPNYHKSVNTHHHNPNHSLNFQSHSAKFTTSVTPSPQTMSPCGSALLTPTTSNSGFNNPSTLKKKNSLKKVISNTNNSNITNLNNFVTLLNSNPHYLGEKLTLTKSLDSTILDSSNSSSQSNLPEFNKRPLTDTPIVSSLASPITREQTSDEEEADDEDDDCHDNDGKQKIQKSEEHPKSTNIEQSDSITLKKTKNISHLNLTDLVEGEQDKEKGQDDTDKEEPLQAPTFFKSNSTNNKASSISPMTSTTPQLIMTPPVRPSTTINVTKSPDQKLTMNAAVKALLLQDLPTNLQEQFEKTPSIEKLKNLLLTKPPPSARKTYTLNIPGQTSSKTSPDGKIAKVDIGSKLVIVMVGLPARGKSYITNKLTRYLNWLQHDCRVFNVGNTRRRDKNNSGPEKKPLPDTHTPNNEPEHPAGSTDNNEEPQEHNADFFNPENKSSTTLREKWAMDTLDQLLEYIINGPGSVGIFDATNSTKQRRLKVLKRINQVSNGELKVLFLESICNDPMLLQNNIRLKLSGPDYKDMDPKVALNDFIGRLQNYEKAYETIDESEEKLEGFQYVKMIDVGKKVVSYNIQGFLASQTIYFLLNFNLCERQIWITRHGESKDNLTGRIGGDSALTKRGDKFSKTLARFMEFQRQEFRKQQLERFSSRLELKYNKELFNEDDDLSSLDDIPTEPNFCVWTSMLTRAIETGQYFDEHLFSIKSMRMLNELGGGKFEGMTYDQIQSKYPKEFDARLRNKLTYRYPGVGGESYLDVLTRLRPLISEIERTTDHLLIISHRVVLRILLAYFLNLDKSNIGELDVPLHTLYCLESHPYGTDYRMYNYDEHLDWFVLSQPDHQKNVQEVGVLFKERKYSVVPTAPPNSRSGEGSSISGSSGASAAGYHQYTDNSHRRKQSTRQSTSGAQKQIQGRKNNPNPASVDNDSSFSVRRSLSFGNHDEEDQARSKNMQDIRNLSINPPSSKSSSHTK
ncbi:6-phosphofructo-2-kinase-domain-containing protein [Scheffersomyces coipomensis]|uniref:6-phosphofructo-2-kinase-domain-containing protein n=1 Tax=Scheffersomyces coipomensis TaxID=1788519 RepID=UPI00315D9946